MGDDLTDSLNKIFAVLSEHIAWELKQAEKLGAEGEHALIMRYLHKRAPELGNAGYRLAEDIDMGLHYKQEGE
jgi:hypothetical protein